MGIGMPEARRARRSKWWLGGTHSQGGDFLSKQPLILAGECIPLPSKIRRPCFPLSVPLSHELLWAGCWRLCELGSVGLL